MKMEEQQTVTVPDGWKLVPVAWLYEWKPRSNNNPWQTDISFKDPRVNPVRELRNVCPLYTTPPADLREENERLKEGIKWLQNDLAGRTGTAKNALNDCSYWQKVATAAEGAGGEE